MCINNVTQMATVIGSADLDTGSVCVCSVSMETAAQRLQPVITVPSILTTPGRRVCVCVCVCVAVQVEQRSQNMTYWSVSGCRSSITPAGA
jgi:hypothetical protein